MSGEPFCCGYGAIVSEDVAVLEACLTVALMDGHARNWDGGPPKLRIVEIGMHDGGTAKGIEDFLAARGVALDYVGIDPDDGTTRTRHVPNDGKVIVGKSAESFHLVEGNIDLLWIDGCHCLNCVVLDTIHYTPKVRKGGFVCFHDVNEVGEGSEHQYHGPDIPEFGLAVNHALAAIRFPWEPWTMFGEAWPTDRHNCGTRAFRKGTT